MKVEKVGTNSYRVRKMYQGKRYDIYFDHVPSKREVEDAMTDKLQGVMELEGSFEQYCDKYIDSKSNVLSPSTIGGYRKIVRTLSDGFKKKKMADIRQIDIQLEVNEYACNHSPKSVRNLHGFITAVLGVFRPNLNISTALPQKKKYNHKLPTTEEVQKILEASKETEYHIAFQLAVLGLRRSEICAATIDDIKGNILTIDKTKLYDGDNHIVIRENTKTEDSTREIYLPDELVNEIHQAGKIYDKTPPMLVKTLHKYQDELGIERFRLHDFRGYYVSYAHSLNIPDEYIMHSGGWRTDFCMKNTYRDVLRDKTEEMQKKIANSIVGG